MAMRAESFRRFTQKACVTFTTGKQPADDGGPDKTDEHPPHRLRPVSGRAVQSDRAAGRGAGAAAPSPAPACAAPRSLSVSYEAVDRELPALLAREQAARSWSCSGSRTRRGTCASKPARAMRCSRADCRTPAGTLPRLRHDRSGGAGDAAVAQLRRSDWCWPRERRACRPRSRAMPAAISATICAGGRPRPRVTGRPRLAAFIHVPNVHRGRVAVAPRAADASTISSAPAKRSCWPRSPPRATRAALTALTATARHPPIVLSKLGTLRMRCAHDDIAIAMAHASEAVP